MIDTRYCNRIEPTFEANDWNQWTDIVMYCMWANHYEPIEDEV